MIIRMNPVVVLLLALNGAAQLVMAQPVDLHPFSSTNKPVNSKLLLGDAQPLRTRSLPQPSSQSIGNHAGPLLTKNGVSFAEVQGFIDKTITKLTTTTTTTESFTSAQPATVDIETLPGFWLKDPSRIPESTGASYEVDYRTERYRLDDLLSTKERAENDAGHREVLESA